MKKTLLSVTIFAWICFAIYEYQVQQWIKTEPTVPIRVDLVLFLPALVGLAILTGIIWIRESKQNG